MKAVEWANLIWLSLLILTFVIAIIYIVVDMRSGKGRVRAALRKLGNWCMIAISRVGSDLRRLFTPPSRRRRLREEEVARAEQFKRAALLRYECPRCQHPLLNIPAVEQVDGCAGTKFFCGNCDYERIEREDGTGS